MVYSQQARRVLDLDGGPEGRHREGWGCLARATAGPPDRARVPERLAAARRQVAALAGLSPHNVVFTSGGAEADNAAVKGFALAALGQGGRPGRIVLSAVEHAPVHDACRRMSALGFEMVLVPVNGAGCIDAGAFTAELERGATVAALQWANDELGTLQPLAPVAAAARAAGVPLHVDATAAAPWVDLTPPPGLWGSLSISCRQLGGPPGAGALLLSGEAPWVPLLDGGAGEDGRRAGELLPALLEAFGASADAARLQRLQRARQARAFRDALAERLRSTLPGATMPAAQGETLPGHLAVVLERVGGESLTAELERSGILAGTGARCSEGAGVPSRILRATGLTPARAGSTLLVRAGADLNVDDADEVAARVAEAVTRLEALSP